MKHTSIVHMNDCVAIIRMVAASGYNLEFSVENLYNEEEYTETAREARESRNVSMSSARNKGYWSKMGASHYSKGATISDKRNGNSTKRVKHPCVVGKVVRD